MKLASRLPVLLAAASVARADPKVVVNRVVDDFHWENPWPHGRSVPLGFEAICEAEKSYHASQHLLSDLDAPPPAGLAPWADAIRFYFGGHPYPGSWDGIDAGNTARDILKMEYTDVPQAVKDWMAETVKFDKWGHTRYMYGVFWKPKEGGDTAQAASNDTEGKDEDKVLFFAAGAIYEIAPLWVAKGSNCEADLLNMANYHQYPDDNGVVAWPIQHSVPDTEQGNHDITFTVKAQILKKAAKSTPTSKSEEEVAKEEDAQTGEAKTEKTSEPGTNEGTDAREKSPISQTVSESKIEDAVSASSSEITAESKIVEPSKVDEATPKAEPEPEGAHKEDTNTKEKDEL